MKTTIFGIFKRNGRLYTENLLNCSKPNLQKVIRGKVSLGGVICPHGLRGCNGPVDAWYGKHFRADHGKDEFARTRLVK